MVWLKLQFAIFLLYFHSNVFAMDVPLSLETYKNVQAKIEWAAINSSEIHKGGLISDGCFQFDHFLYIKCAKSLSVPQLLNQ